MIKVLRDFLPRERTADLKLNSLLTHRLSSKKQTLKLELVLAAD